MNILSISMILPVPGFKSSNDFVFQTCIHYRRQYENDTIVMIRPVKFDFNPVNIFRKNAPLKKMKEKVKDGVNGFRVEILPFFTSWRYRNIHALITRSIYFLHVRRLKQLFLSYNFDIIHAQLILPDGLLAYYLSKAYNIPYVLTTHNERFYFEHVISRRIAIRVMKNASAILPINHSNYSYYLSLKLSNIELLPLGFSRNFVRPQKIRPQKKIKILTVAELIKLKNIDKVILAFNELVKKYDVHYTIIGKGPEKKNLTDLVYNLKINNKVTFIEYIPYDKIAGEVYKHDIFIMPSYFETFGRVYFEAMAMGMPIICAKNSGIYGIFKEMEEGISVNHESIQEIIHALEFLIINPEERLRIGANGKKLVEKYTWENIATSLHDRYSLIVHDQTNK